MRLINVFYAVSKRNSCNILECSRQNIAYMVKQQHLVPIKENVKGNLYLKGDILNNKW